jgi:hypothetical protein
MEIITALIIMFGFMLWNLFAVIGIFATLVWGLSRIKGNSKVEKKPVESTVQKPVEKKARVQQDKSPKKINTTVLLYVGAMLVIFSIFTFVALNWNNYSDTIKVCILVVSTVSFYLIGILSWNRKIIRDVGITFIVIGSFSLAFSGFGLWQFFFENNSSFTFWEYWLIHSGVMVVTYSITAYIVGIRRFFYLVIIAMYSVFISFAFAFTDVTEMRITLITIFNLLFYLLWTILSDVEERRVVTFISRLVNIALGSFIFVEIVRSFYQIDTNSEKFIAILALLIPVLFGLVVWHRKERAYTLELGLIGAFLLSKLLIILRIINIHIDLYQMLIVAGSLYVISYLLIVFWRKKLDGLQYLFVPATIVSGLFLLVAPYDKPVWESAWSALPLIYSYGVIALSIIVFAYIKKLDWIRAFAIPAEFIIFIAFLMLIDSYGIIEFYHKEWMIGILAFVPASIYFVESMVNYIYKQKIHSSILGTALFSLVGLLATVGWAIGEPNTYLYSVIAVIFVLVYVLTYLYYTKKPIFTFVIYLLSYYFVLVFLLLMDEWFGGIEYLYDLILFGWSLLVLKYIGLYVVSIERKLILEERDYRWFARMSVATGIVMFILMFERIINTDSSYLTAATLSVLGLSFYIHNNRAVKLSSGIFAVLVSWFILIEFDRSYYYQDVHTITYAIPLAVYSLVLSYLTRDKVRISKLLELTTYLIPAFVLLIDSIFFKSLRTILDDELIRITYGMLLIALSVLFILYGIKVKEKLFIYIPFVFIVIELFIRLYDVIVSIPWWLYLGLIGLSVIGIATYLIIKLNSKDHIEPPIIKSEKAEKLPESKVKVEKKKSVKTKKKTTAKVKKSSEKTKSTPKKTNSVKSKGSKKKRSTKKVVKKKNAKSKSAK